MVGRAAFAVEGDFLAAIDLFLGIVCFDCTTTPEEPPATRSEELPAPSMHGDVDDVEAQDLSVRR